MAQCVFDRGELVAWHACLRACEGAAGGASHKRSTSLPAIREHLAVLGRELGWHGALSADAILSDAGPCYIDINPRLVEPGNAWRAGVDLVTPMLDLAAGTAPPPQPGGRPDIRTHQLLIAVLGAAQRTGRRRDVAAELLAAARRAGDYAGQRRGADPGPARSAGRGPGGAGRHRHPDRASRLALVHGRERAQLRAQPGGLAGAAGSPAAAS